MQMRARDSARRSDLTDQLTPLDCVTLRDQLSGKVQVGARQPSAVIDIDHVATEVEPTNDAHHAPVSGAHGCTGGAGEVGAHVARRDGAVEFPTPAESARYARVSWVEEGLPPEPWGLVRRHGHRVRAVCLAFHSGSERGIGWPSEGRSDGQALDGVLTPSRRNAGVERVRSFARAAEHLNT